ncbi:DnaD domain protein [uncultured Megasphaera sp.]|uniref:DnaD domain protein n=1 Tax=uncultured Megasphaera sp. TaxID=165188 RepID=UPI00266DB915|nr:DnaD domain protein [uncultured Megasphaera sp.]
MERLNIKYIDQINAFHGWLLTNPIPASARIVWFSLIHFCNKTGWKAEFNLAMSALETDTGLSRRTIERARSILQEAGLIHVKARAGNQSPIYKIIPFARQYDAQTVAQSDAQNMADGHDDAQSDAQNMADGHDDAQSDAQSVAQSDHIPRHKDIKTKDNRVYDDVGYKEVLKAYRKNIYPMPGEMDLEKLKALADDFGSDTVIKAIDRAVTRNKRSLAYIHGILKSWQAGGYDDENTARPQPTPRNSKKEAIDVVNRLMAEYQAQEGDKKDDSRGSDPESDWGFATGVSK